MDVCHKTPPPIYGLVEILHNRQNDVIKILDFISENVCQILPLPFLKNPTIKVIKHKSCVELVFLSTHNIRVIQTAFAWSEWNLNKKLLFLRIKIMVFVILSKNHALYDVSQSVRKRFPTWRDLKKKSRPLFTIIFWPKMNFRLRFHFDQVIKQSMNNSNIG